MLHDRSVFIRSLSFRMNFNDHINLPHTLLPVNEGHKYQHLTCWIIKVDTLVAIASTSNCCKDMSGDKTLCKVAESSSKVCYLHTVQHHTCHHHPHPSQQVWDQHLQADRNGRLILYLSLGCFDLLLHRLALCVVMDLNDTVLSESVKWMIRFTHRLFSLVTTYWHRLAM